jgi:hypothetical protein
MSIEKKGKEFKYTQVVCDDGGSNFYVIVDHYKL